MCAAGDEDANPLEQDDRLHDANGDAVQLGTHKDNLADGQHTSRVGLVVGRGQLTKLKSRNVLTDMSH